MRALVLLLALLLPHLGGAEDVIPPADAKVVNVKDFGAKGDGVADDTEALRTAIHETFTRIRNSRYATPPMIWLPAGTYRVSGPIEGRTRDHQGWSSGWLSGLLLVGQGRDRTTIRLTDGAEGYGDPANPRWVLATGSETDAKSNPTGGGNRAFRHAIMHLTVDVGARNPGAVGIDFLANNRGTVEDVLVRAGGESGLVGISMNRKWPGPALIKDVRIEGFATGVLMTAHYEYSMTFDGLELEGQRTVGMDLRHNGAFISRLSSRNRVPAIRQQPHGLLTLHRAKAEAPAGTTGAAFELDGAALLRDVSVAGYAVAIDDRSARDQDVAGGGTVAVPSWRLGTEIPAGGNPRPLDLPVEPTPLYRPRDAQEWINGAADLQAAIDSGKPVVYLPNGSYTLDRTIVIRGAVRKIVGFQSSLGLSAQAGTRVLFRFEGGAADTTILEHLWMNGEVEHAGAGTLVVRHCDLHGFPKSGEPGYRGTGPGRSFLEDVMGHVQIGTGHRLWARQLNSEFSKHPLLRNHGGTLWVLGFKTEGETTGLEAIGGESEIFGALLYPLRKFSPDIPAIINDGGRVSATWANSGSKYALKVRERTAGGEWREDRTEARRSIVLYSSERQPPP